MKLKPSELQSVLLTSVSFVFVYKQMREHKLNIFGVHYTIYI